MAALSQDATAALLDPASTDFSDEEVNEQAASGANSVAQSDTSVREIYKNSWLKQIPCTEKWTGRLYKSQKPEKFWVVFCVHDEKDPFLEFYENRRSAYSHNPLSSVSLAQCWHISPSIVVQENDHEFVITLQSQVIRLAASTREQMVEWMDTMKNKLRELSILEPKDNLYSREPVSSPRSSTISCTENGNSDLADSSPQESAQSLDINRISLRDPNSPLPPVPEPPAQPVLSRVEALASVVYVRNPTTIQPSPSVSSLPGLAPRAVTPVHITPESTELPSSHPANRTVQPAESGLGEGAASASFCISPAHVSSSSLPDGCVENSLYEPLFCATACTENLSLTAGGVRNPSYENPPDPQRAFSSESRPPVLPPRPTTSSRRSLSVGSNESPESSRDCSRNSVVQTFSADQTQNSNLDNSHVSNLMTRRYSSEDLISSSHLRYGRELQAHGLSQSETQDPSHNSISSVQHSMHQRNVQSCSVDSPFPTDESGRILSLREAQVLRLQSEINHKSGVRLVLRRKDCISAVAFVECFGSVWVAGWKQKEHPLLHNAFHVGDRILSVAGHRIHAVQEALKIIKLQNSVVEFVVRRTPYAKVLAIKREYEGQDLGIIREGGTAEIKEVKPGSLALRYGLPAKAPVVDGIGPCNWFLTEINHRPVNLFFKDNEVHDRLNAVGLDISILVQPVDFVKALKKHLKAIRGYKDYILQ